VNKHSSRIGQDVQVGSNSVLWRRSRSETARRSGRIHRVREVPAGGLTLARARQVTIAGWKRPAKKVKD